MEDCFKDLSCKRQFFISLLEQDSFFESWSTPFTELTSGILISSDSSMDSMVVNRIFFEVSAYLSHDL